MKLLRLAVPLLASLTFIGCDNSTEPKVNTPGPQAYVRFVHAMPDMGPVNARLIDKVENLNVGGETYRFVGPYQGIDVGSRHFRVFPSSTDINVASRVLIDATVPLEAGKYYTLIASGYTATGATPQAQLVVLTDNAPTPSGSQVAVRSINAVSGLGAIDVYTSPSGAPSPLPATATMTGISAQPLSPSSYATFATGPLVLRATAAGTTNVLAEFALPAGAAGTTVIDPTPGSSIGGTVLTAFFFPRGVAGSGAASFTTPGVAYGVDRRPPRPTS
jgi:hypothetical protein